MINYRSKLWDQLVLSFVTHMCYLAFPLCPWVLVALGSWGLGHCGQAGSAAQTGQGRGPSLNSLAETWSPCQDSFQHFLELFKTRQQLIRVGREPRPAPMSGEDAFPVSLYLHSYSGWLYESESSLSASRFYEMGHGLILVLESFWKAGAFFSPKYEPIFGSQSWSNYCCYQQFRIASEFPSRGISIPVTNESSSSMDLHWTRWAALHFCPVAGHLIVVLIFSISFLSLNSTGNMLPIEGRYRFKMD